VTVVFQPLRERSLEQLRADIAKHRDVGRARVEFRRVEAADASAHATATAFVKSLGMQAPNEWTELDAAGAFEATTRIIQNDLVYGAPIMAIETAEMLSRRFLQTFAEAPIFLTNGHGSLGRSGMSGAWSPLTDATFDTGIIGVSPGRVGLLWFEEED
jgi:hypothetical protein